MTVRYVKLNKTAPSFAGALSTCSTAALAQNPGNTFSINSNVGNTLCWVKTVVGAGPLNVPAVLDIQDGDNSRALADTAAPGWYPTEE